VGELADIVRGKGHGTMQVRVWGEGISRRALISGSAALAGCAGLAAPAAGEAARPRRVFDAHCHVFNAADLPVYAFAETTRGFDEHPLLRLLRPLLCSLTEVVALVAPTPSEEIEILDGRAQPGPFSIRARRIPAAFLARGERDRDIDVVTAALLNTGVVPWGQPRCLERFDKRNELTRGCSDTAGVRKRRLGEEQSRRDRVLALLLRAQNEAPVARHRAEWLLDDTGAFGRLTRWAVTLTRYRHRLVDDLLSQYAAEGIPDAVLAPSLIDYDYWLEDYGSTEIRHQIAVNERLVRRRGGRVLPIVAFDPWRHVLDVLYNKWAPRHGRGARVTAMEWVRRAVMERGFVGVKIYPPMGFRPLGNADLAGLNQQRPGYRIGAWEIFPHELIPPDCEGEDFWAENGLRKGGDSWSLYDIIGRKLDESLAELFDFCVRNQVPVMTHCRDSQEPTTGYAKRAHPQFWRRVVETERWAGLRLNLGHFGDMYAMAAGPSRDRAASWAWQVAALANKHPGVYTDVGYFEPIMIGDGEAAAARFFAELGAMRSGMPALDRKIMFGSDYHLTGLNENHRVYFRRFAAAFARGDGDVGREDRFFFANAVRYLGLEPGGPAWARMAPFHAANPAILAERRRLFRNV